MPSSSVLSVPAAIGVVTLCLGVLSCLYIIRDQRRRPAPAMPVMTWVWPINALWAGPLAVWAYRSLGAGRLPRNGERGSASAGPGMTRAMDMARMDMSGRDMPGMNGKHAQPFWQSVVTGTLHCGAGCTLADLVGPWLFRLAPFTLWGHAMYGEWALEYVLALLFGVGFQYAGLASMTRRRGAALWWRAFKVDVLSLTAWQVGMYAWMAVCMFVLGLPLSPASPVFWFMMQVSMLCGFMTSYPMNWALIRTGVKTAM
ncbi:MAG: DUF4396 domain-containing protein [Desulfovibrionaceae bacterium]|nr:DUF4396 domain-containing protein [Desulfovibrionaceae bacterium]